MRRSNGILPSDGYDTGLLDRIRSNTADIDELKEQLEAALKRIDSLEARVKALETP